MSIFKQLMSASNPLVRYWSFIEKLIGAIIALTLFYAGIASMSKDVEKLTRTVELLKEHHEKDSEFLIELRIDSQHRDEIIKEMREELRDLRKKLEDRKIVAGKQTKVNVAGEKYEEE